MKSRRYMFAVLLAAGVLSVAGCSKTSDNAEQKPAQNQGQEQTPEVTPEVDKEEESKDEGKLMYSCLVDTKTQEEVKQQLLDAGIQEESVDIFLQWVAEYNDNVKQASAFQEGYQASEVSPVAFEDLELKDEFREDGTFKMDMNCRLTAYLLMRQFIQTNQSIEDYDPYLVFDIEELDTADRFKAIRDDRTQFITLYDPIAVKEGSKVDEHVEAIQKAWKDRDIKLEGNENVSLILMYLHDSLENKRFVGHAAVMVNTPEGILLVEKYGWNMPFQCTQFDTEDQMTEYLLSRPDLAGDDSEEPVIVMKDDTVISK